MSEKYKVIDNFLDKEEFIKLQDIFLSADVPYYFNKVVTFEDETTNNFMFTHTLYRHNVPNSDYFNEIVPILEKLNIFALQRAKINCYTRTENLIVHAKHRDYEIKHKGAVYFFNTCNGKTIIENDSIDSVENRIVLFDPSILHASTNCTDEQARFTLNINYM
jgi:hypothetical protein